MTQGHGRVFAALMIAGALLLATAGPAFGVETVRPSGCHIRADELLRLNVFSYDNPNAAAVDIPLGSDNIILQAPNFRKDQPTHFLPGFVENAWSVVSNYQRTPELDWYLQGVTAGDGDRCQAPGAPQSVLPPSIQGDVTAGSTVTLDPGTWTGATTVRHFYRIDVCDDGGGCVPYTVGGTTPMSGPVPYTVPSDVRGRRLRLTVGGFSSRGIAIASSALSDPVGPGGAGPAAPTQRSTVGTTVQLVGDLAVVPEAQQVWNGVPAPAVSQQWQRCTPDCADIPGDTALVHHLVAADEGASLRVVTTAANDSGTATQTSPERAIGAVPGSDTEPIPVDFPHLSGTAGIGLSLHAFAGIWAGDGSADVQWQRCDGSGCTDITGATDGTYVPTEADAGLRLRAMVTAQNDVVPTSGFLPATFTYATELTSPVTAGPQSLRAPQIAGSGDVGSPLRLASTGAWSAPLEAATTTWERCLDGHCDAIPGAAGDRYVPTAADAGASIRAVVAGRTANGVTSAASAPLGPIGSVRAIAAPAVSGDPVEGASLLASFGDWIGTPAPGFSGQWLSCDGAGEACTAINGATGALYRPAAGDRGHTLRFRVHGANAFSSDTTVSAATAPVASSTVTTETPVRDRKRPRLTHVALSRRTFRVGRHRTALAARARRGARLRFRVSEAGWLRVDVRRAKRRRRPLATLTRVVRAGRGSFAFTGRIGHARLRRGRYVASVRATDAAGNRSAVRKVRFRIAR